MIDQELLGHGDYVQVRAALIREVGVVEAIVLQRIHFRTSEEYRHSHEWEGEWWWAASAELIAKETGLTPKQVRVAVGKLREAGHVIAEPHKFGGASDKTLSYRVATQQEEPFAPEGKGPFAPQGKDPLPHRANAPYIRPSRTTDVVLQDSAILETDPFEEDGFDKVWAAWPRKHSRLKAKTSWGRLSRSKRAAVTPLLFAHAEAHRKYTPVEFVPMLATWLNQERWDDPLAQPRSSGKVSPSDRARQSMEAMLGLPAGRE